MRFPILGLLAAIAATMGGWSASAQDWQEGAGPDWQRILADAKKEGSVVVTGPAELADPIAAGFLRDTGIKVEFLGPWPACRKAASRARFRPRTSPSTSSSPERRCFPW
ncbi:MAG TPA: hypothetical protein VN802_12530 [Stellaceae bacterium]|nr:hypothetical protein [Stellaceae bacterium]